MLGTFFRMNLVVEPQPVRDFSNLLQLLPSALPLLTIRFRTPSCSMNAITFCCAPAPSKGIATTAATPNNHPQHRQPATAICASPGFPCQIEDRAAIAPGIFGDINELSFIALEDTSLRHSAYRRTSARACLGFPVGFFSGFTTPPRFQSGMPSRIARPSLSARTFTSFGSNPPLRWQ